MTRAEMMMERLRQLRNMGTAPVVAAAPPPVPSTGPGRDVFLPPQGPMDPRLPIAHLPRMQRDMMLQQMKGG